MDSVLEILDGAAPLAGPIADEVRERFEPHAGELALGGIVVGVSRGGEREMFAFKGDLAKRYDIGSVTKTFTGVLLAHMVYGGEVALEDPVAKHLPDHVTMPRGDRDITLLDLSTHTSGFPRMAPTTFGEDYDEARPYAHVDVPRLYAELAKTELEYPTGTQSLYSNLAVGLLGHALSLVAGQPYAQIVHERILGPLGMRATGFDGAGVIECYAGGVAVPRWTGVVYEPAGIGLSCTADDLLTWAEAPCDPMVTPLAESFNAALAKRVEHEPAGPRTEQGLGWIRFVLDDASVLYFHNGGTAGFRSTLWAHAPTRTAVVALCNEAEIGSALDLAGAALIASMIKGVRS
jgi:serine-type D-Ala-D-Ala carboxypeptidase/endopeptidase